MLPVLRDIELRRLPARHLCGGELGCAGNHQDRHVHDVIESTTRFPRHVCLSGAERLVRDTDPDELRQLRRKTVVA